MSQAAAQYPRAAGCQGAAATAPTILGRLKHATRVRHAALEARLPLLDPRLSCTAYRDCVGGFFGYYAPLEARLRSLPWWETLGFDYQPRRKTPRLLHDLHALGHDSTAVATLPLCQALPALATPGQLLGCLYVIEGATLGGRIIGRHLEASLGLTAERGAAFFSGYGAATGPLWQAFGEFLRLRAADNDEAEIISGAAQTFDTLALWLYPPSPAGAT